MLLVFDDSIIEMTDSFLESQSQALENIASALREGKHIVAGSRTVFEKLKQLDCLTLKAKAIFLQAFNSTSEYGSLVKHLERHIRIFPTVVANGGFVFNEQTKSINVSLVKFNDTAIVQETILLAENLLDARFYEIVANAYKWKTPLSGLKVQTKRQGGGGNTIADEYKEIQNCNDRLCICVVDSDKKFPWDICGETARKVKKVNDENCPLTEFIYTHYRMAENMLSSVQLAEVCDGDNNRLKFLDILKRIEKSSIPEIRGYLNFKHGLCLKEIYQYDQSNPRRQYWHSNLANVINVQPEKNRLCLDNGHCSEHIDCACQIIDGMGESILNNCVDNMSMKSHQKQAESVCLFTKQEWKRIGSLVFSWCCGGNRTVT